MSVWHNNEQWDNIITDMKLRKIELKTILSDSYYDHNTFIFIYKGQKYLSQISQTSEGFVYFDTGREAVDASHATIYEFINDETNPSLE